MKRARKDSLAGTPLRGVRGRRGEPSLPHIVATFLIFVAGGAFAKPLEIKLPEETARLIESPLPGYPLALATCATCHSADYVQMQPVSSRTYWKNTVTKMQKTFAAPIPDEMVEPLVEYLVKTYGNERSGGAAPAAKSQEKPAKK